MKPSRVRADSLRPGACFYDSKGRRYTVVRVLGSGHVDYKRGKSEARMKGATKVRVR